METIGANNGFFEFVTSEEEFIIDGKSKNVKRNFVRRPPGIRALIVDKDKKSILFSKEFRYELNDWDLRLPGGKVFDSLDAYKESLDKDDVLDHVEITVPKEVLEEIGLIVENPKLIKVSKDGAGVVWDLFYYEITDYKVSENGPHLEEDEVIEGYVWKTFDEIIDLCATNKIHEDRTVGVLLTYILKNK